MTDLHTIRRKRGVLHTGRASVRPGSNESEARYAMTADTDDRLLDKNGAAAFLGVAPRTLYKWAAQGRLPVVRLGRRAVRFRVGALRALVATHEEPATKPLSGVVVGGIERAPSPAP